MPDPKQIITMSRWLLPTRLELAGYGVVGVITFLLSNLQAVERALLLPGNFSIQLASLSSVDTFLEKVLGTQISSSLTLAIFWGLVGIVVYMLLWMTSNFSSEVSTDLAVRKYIRPRGADPNRALKSFLEHSLFRLASTFILLFYINTLIQVFLPVWSRAFQRVIEHWFDIISILIALLMVLIEVCALHAITILLRLAMLRKRVFGEYIP